MKRLFTLIMFLSLWAGSSWGQTTVTIGTGTLTQRQPFGVYWGYERSAAIYTSAEIGMTGTITHLGWYVGTAYTTNVPLKIYLNTTASSTLTASTWATMIAGATEVYNGTLQFTPTGWFTIDITDFGYSSDNLLVLCETNYTGGGTSSYPLFRYSTATSQHEYWNADNNPPTGNGTVNSNRPNIQITLTQSSMTFTSATTLTATTAPVLVNSADQPVVVLQVVTNGTLNPFDVTSIDFTTTGTTSTSDITSAKVYFTTTTTFSTTTQFGSTVNNPGGSFTVTGTQTLAGVNNYFWLCYDISGTATEFNVVDGTCAQFATSEPQTRTPTVTDPAGNRTIRSQLAGTYTIDNTNPTGGTNYNNFTDALDDLNNLGHSAAVTFNVSAGQTFSKTVPAAPTNYTYLVMDYIGSASNPVIFQKSGAGANPILSVTGSAATNDIGVFLYGCDYVSFNGIDIADAGTTAADYLEWGYYLQGPADNNCQYVTIQNCTIDLNKANTLSRGIYSYANAPTSSAGANNNNTYSNNTIQDAYNGIYLSSNSTYRDENNVVSENVIQNLGNNLSTVIYGIYAYYQKNVSVTGNSVDNMTGNSTMYGIYSYYWDGLTNYLNDNNVMNLTGTSTSSTMYGIYHSPSSTATTEISGNTVTGLDHKYHVYGLYVGAGTLNNIFNNEIYNIAYTGTSSFIAYGLGSVGGTTNSIYNNYIYDIKAPASTGTPGTRALHFGGGTTANVYFNTVYIDYTSTIASNQSAALYVTTSPTTLNLNNNIFVNNCDMTTGTRAVAFYKSTTSLANLPNSNNNNLFYAGTPGAKNLIFYNTTPYPTLAEFQTLVTPRENLSVTENPPFNSVSAPYDLHVPNTSTTVAESGGINISGINDDWDGDIRQGSPGYAGTGVSPDIGADEFDGTNPNLASIDMGATALVSPVASGCYTAAETVTVTIKNWGTQLIDFSVNNVTVSTDVNGAVTQSLTATLSSGTLAAGATVNVDMSTTLDMTTAGTYTFNAYTTVTGDGNAANDAMAPVNRTVVASTPLPYIQNFDAGTSSPPGWITTGWTIGTTHANPSTGNGLYKNIWSSAPSGQFTLLKLGPVTATDNLKFDYRIVNYTSYPTTATPNIPAWGNIVINISSDCGMTFSPFATIDPTNHIESTSWATLSFSLAGLAGFDIIIQVAASWSAGDYYVDFDNFEIQTPPACLAPTLQTVANHTTTGADLGWTDATGTHWDLYIVPKDDPAPDGSTTPTVNNTTSNPYTWSGGSENNNYDWYVRSDCDPGNNNTNVSSWAGPNTFSTLCNPISTFPFTENFNGVTVPNLPNCFFQNNANGDGDKWITYTTYGVGGTICAGLYTDYNSGANDDYLILPRLTLSGNQLLKFSVRARSSSEPNDYRVVLSTTGNSPANFTTELMPLTVVSTTIMTEIAPIDLTAYTGNVWIAIHVPPGGLDGYYLYVDDIIVEDIPTCPAPSALTATNITTTSAVLGWTPGGTEQMWSVEVGAPGFTPGTNTSILSEYYTTDNPWTASPLVASTDYEFYVQAYCNGFENPKVDYFWMAMDAPGNLLVPLSGGTADDIDETGEWYQYFDPEEELPWWNIWFYNDPLDEERMKKVRIGFWVNSFDGILDGELNYVINWSTPEWSLLDPPPATPFPMPTDELYIQRSPLNGPIMIRPGIPQWIELLYIIPDYNPEWISVDIWGANIFIEEFPMSPPPGSPLLEWWDPLMPGGIIVHECLPKGHNTSSWSGPKAFSTLCGAFPVPYTENFDGVVTPAIPNCMTVTNDNGDGVTWLTSSLYARSAPNSMYIGFNGSLDMDDWFFTPALTLAPGVYNVSFWYRNSGITYPEKLEVKWGSAPNVTGMTQGPIFNNNNIINSTYAEGSGVITISTAGDYYVGWHGYSDMDMWYLCVDDISVTRKLDHDVATLSVNDPPAVYDPTPIIPKALVKNLGTNTETFSVTMTITGGYTSTKNVTSLAPDASVVVPFDLWTPVVGNYSVQTCTNLGTDEDNSNDCLSKTVDVFDYTRFYCYVAFPGTSSLPEGPAYFYREAPGTINSIAPTTTEFIAAGTWANGIWYASEYYDNTVIPATGGGWYTIDPTTGVMTLLASLGRSFNGITYDLTNQVMYGIDYDGTALTNNLYSIIPSTGVATLIGTIGPGEVLINLATDGAGYLYALGISTDHLFKINPVGPVLTDVGATGVALSYAQDMEYDHETNTMFAAGYTSTGSLYSVNLTSGACTFIGAFAGGAEITGLAIPYCVTMNQWTGNYSTAWNDARNWTCGVVPGASDKVFISSAPSGNRFPVVANGVTAVCYDVTIQPGAIMTVETGGTLNVLNP